MRDKIPKGKRRIFLLKVDLPALMAFILFAGMIFLYLIPGFEKVMMDRKRNLIHEMTASVYSLLEHYHSLETAGAVDRTGAQEQAMGAVGNIRYGEDLKDYFWITDRQPVMITHPYRPDLNGQDLNGFRDSKGKTIFVEFVKAVAETGESYVEYMWQWNDDSTRVVPKLSYVRLFEPWGWVIGTGIYIEDVRHEIRRLEIRVVAISAIFGLVIMALLFAMSRQSHKIEQKRSRAEDELRKSRELYRTLAEAASEGVIIWSDQGVQANKTLLSWIGLSEDELLNRKLTDILESDISNGRDDPGKLWEELSARQYTVCMLKTEAGSTLSCHADFSRLTLGDRSAVLIVIRPAAGHASASAIQLPVSLLDSAGIGFFRLTYSKNPRFIHATAPTLDLLGYHDIRELQRQNVDSLFADARQAEMLREMLQRESQFFNREVVLRKRDGREFRALVSLRVVNAGTDEPWCDGSLELISVSATGQQLPVSGYDPFGASYIMGTPVSAVMRPPVTCSENTPLDRVSSLMKENNTGVIIVLNNNGEPLGVADAASMGVAIVGGMPSGSEIFRIMHAPPQFVREDDTVAAALDRIRNSPAGCLLVTGKTNRVTGMVTDRDLAHAAAMTPALLLEEIKRAESVNGLRKIWQAGMRASLAMLHGHGDAYSISLTISTVADAICQRVMEIAIGEAGKPPCRFSFIQTGSAGRREQSFLTDQDNAIIFENLSGERLEKANDYFLALGKRVNVMLDTIGFSLCKGNNMAGNLKWCQPLDVWKDYFADWIRVPGPSEILDISIFFDFRFCFGDEALCDELREYVKTSLQAGDIFFYHMSSALRQFNPSHSVLSEETTDIKRLLMALTGAIRLYALKHGIDGHSTVDRILGLHDGKHISNDLLRRAVRAWKDLSYIRLSHQAACMDSGREPDNRVDFRVRQAGSQFAAALAIDDINELMLKAGNDFHSVTI
jgi:signal-transduction protein with cAMP-binding, CBS, and nucleotidyltransferase domain/PAS domain-containing protein